MDLRVEDVSLLKMRAPLPWEVVEYACIIDANGHTVARMEIGLGDDEAVQIAHMIVLAVNTCGGYKAVAEPA